MTEHPRFTFRIPQRVADKHIKARRKAEADQDYKPITWAEWFDSDPRINQAIIIGPIFDKEETK